MCTSPSLVNVILHGCSIIIIIYDCYFIYNIYIYRCTIIGESIIIIMQSPHSTNNTKMSLINTYTLAENETKKPWFSDEMMESGVFIVKINSCWHKICWCREWKGSLLVLDCHQHARSHIYICRLSRALKWIMPVLLSLCFHFIQVIIIYQILIWTIMNSLAQILMKYFSEALIIIIDSMVSRQQNDFEEFIYIYVTKYE